MQTGSSGLSLDIWSNHFCPSVGPNGGSAATGSEENKTLKLSIMSNVFFQYVFVFCKATVININW